MPTTVRLTAGRDVYQHEHSGSGVDAIYAYPLTGPVAISGRRGDEIEGSLLDDLIYVAGDKDSVEALDGNDTIYANGLTVGARGADLDGGAGDDIVYGSFGKDTIHGGQGVDRLYGGAAADLIYGGAGNDTAEGGAGRDSLYGNEGDDILDGGADRDMLNGDAGADQLNGGDGDDTLYGWDGNDRLVGGAGLDLLYGGDGNDVIFYGAGSDRAYGGAGDDFIDDVDGMQLSGDNILDGGTGNDTIFANQGSDKVYGGDGNDTLYGEDHNDTIYGGAGDDVIYAGASVRGRQDVLYGGAGVDTLYGTSTASSGTRYQGDAGNDLIVGSTSNQAGDMVVVEARSETDHDGMDTVLNFDPGASRGSLRDVVQFRITDAMATRAGLSENAASAIRDFLDTNRDGFISTADSRVTQVSVDVDPTSAVNLQSALRIDLGGAFGLSGSFGVQLVGLTRVDAAALFGVGA